MAHFTEHPVLGQRYAQALIYATQIHRNQVRKDGTPYLAHLLGVSGLVLEAGGSEAEAIAALLHDAVEDVGVTCTEIQGRFGAQVAWIVGQLSENKDLPKPQRKAQYVEMVAASDPGVILVSCADKLHNHRSYATTGQHLWDVDAARFYEALMHVYRACPRVPQHWLAEMEYYLEILGGVVA